MLFKIYSEKEERISELEKDLDKVTAKALKYEDSVGKMQEAVRELQRAKEELEAKLKAETKTSAGTGERKGGGFRIVKSKAQFYMDSRIILQNRVSTFEKILMLKAAKGSCLKRCIPLQS